MKIVRFKKGDAVRYGILKGEKVLGLKSSPFQGNWDWEAIDWEGTEYALGEVKLLVPCEPSKYLGVGLNFVGAAKAAGRPAPSYPVTFLKPTSALVADGENIEIKMYQDCQYLYEGEMAAVIGKTAKNVSREEALDYVLGYTCSNDVTDFTQVDKDALRFKCADTFAPTGPCIETEVDPSCVRIRSFVNGELRQDGNTGEFIFDVPSVIEFFSSYMTLYPGDVISMGTPAGAGRIKPGDVLRIEVEGIGVLENKVRAV